MESQRLMRPGGRNAEPDSSSPRVYFLTDTKFYELVFMWSDPEADHAAERGMSEWQAMLLSPLRELPMGGFDLTLMVHKVHDGSSNLLHISSQLREYEDIRCVPSRVGAINLGLPRPVLFVVPSFTTPRSTTGSRQRETDGITLNTCNTIRAGLPSLRNHRKSL